MPVTANDRTVSPIRLALVTTELRVGGAERCLANLAIGLDRNAFAPHVYGLAPQPAGERATLVEMLRDAQVPVDFVGVRRPWQFLRAVRCLRKLLQKQSPQLIQSFQFHANAVTALAAGGMDVPLLAGLRVAQHQRLRRWVDRRLAGRFAGHVCVSDDVAAAAMRDLELPPERLHVIPNGVRESDFASLAPADLTKLGAGARRRVILFAGRFEPQKGADVLLAAAAEFLPKLPDCELLLVGEGGQSKQLRELAQLTGATERIHFAPWQSNLRGVMAAADLVAIPSRWEGMSNTLLEAMACGKAVVATDAEGMRQVLGPLADGQLVLRDDPLALARRICELMIDNQSASSFAVANRQRAFSTFSLAGMIDAYQRLFLAAVGRLPPRGG